MCQISAASASAQTNYGGSLVEVSAPVYRAGGHDSLCALRSSFVLERASCAMMTDDSITHGT